MRLAGAYACECCRTQSRSTAKLFCTSLQKFQTPGSNYLLQCNSFKRILGYHGGLLRQSFSAPHHGNMKSGGATTCPDCIIYFKISVIRKPRLQRVDRASDHTRSAHEVQAGLPDPDKFKKYLSNQNQCDC